MPSLLREEIISTYDSKIFALNKEEPTYEARKNILKEKKKKNLMLLKALKKNKKAKKRKFQNVDDKITQYLDPRKTKMIVGFNDSEPASIKTFAVKKN